MYDIIDPENLDRLETVTDISKACQMALSILNDLLNYDKLEDGTYTTKLS